MQILLKYHSIVHFIKKRNKKEILSKSFIIQEFKRGMGHNSSNFKA